MDSRQELGIEEQDTFPAVDEALVKGLDKIFPLRSPSPDWRNRQIWIEVGQQNVINLLKEHLKRQQENVLR
tara:strand:+ start:198 stop:410 length:213 start_codon:yes stop_codon:yes gene_type:complete